MHAGAALGFQGGEAPVSIFGKAAQRWYGSKTGYTESVIGIPGMGLLEPQTFHLMLV